MTDEQLYIHCHNIIIETLKQARNLSLDVGRINVTLIELGSRMRKLKVDQDKLD